MCFLMKIFCFLLVLNYVTTETFVEFTFNAMPLGHSGLLIFWEPNITPQSEENAEVYIFRINYTVVEESNEIYESEDDQSLISEEEYEEDYDESSQDVIRSSAKQYKIHSLEENTLYNITIEQFEFPNKDNIILKQYSVQIKTNLKSERIPAKPYFEYTPSIGGNAAKFRWYPCGRERICNGQESGTHFGMTIKEPYTTRRRSDVKIDELYSDYINIQFWAGIVYEVVVYSVNGRYKTDSDSIEIFVEPALTPVQYVNIISLPDLSTLISWKPPKLSLEGPLLGTCLHYFNLSDPNADISDQVWFGEDIEKFEKMLTQAPLEYEQIRIFNLKPEVMYSYVLLPYSNVGFGFPYRKKHKLQIYNQDLQIAKPDFNYKLERESLGFNVETCNFYFRWLPCGESLDCGNFKPGSNYSFHLKPEPVNEDYSYKHGYYEGSFKLTEIYTVTLTSSIGNNLSAPVTKMFKNCDEIREDIPLKEDQN